MTGSGEATGGRTRGPLPPAATARAASPGTRRSPAARAQSRAPAWAGGAGRTPGRSPDRLPRAAAGAGRPGAGAGGRLTWRGRRAGGRLGSCGGGGDSSRWLRLALAARDGKMAAARHPHPGTAGGGGARRAGRRERGGGGGARPARRWTARAPPLPQLRERGALALRLRVPSADPPRTLTAAPRLCPLALTAPLSPGPRPPAPAKPVNQSAPQFPTTTKASACARAPTPATIRVCSGLGQVQVSGAMRVAGTLLVRWTERAGAGALGPSSQWTAQGRPEAPAH